jgi:hypothetical protein
VRRVHSTFISELPVGAHKLEVTETVGQLPPCWRGRNLINLMGLNTKNSINQEEQANAGLLCKTQTDMASPDGNEMVIMSLI